MPGLDGLPETDIIGDQQVDPGHLESADHGIKLVVFNINAGAERGMEGTDVRRGRSSPAYRVEKGVQLLRRIEASRGGQGDLFDEDVSEVLVCYSLGVYETQSNPQAT